MTQVSRYVSPRRFRYHTTPIPEPIQSIHALNFLYSYFNNFFLKIIGSFNLYKLDLQRNYRISSIEHNSRIEEVTVSTHLYLPRSACEDDRVLKVPSSSPTSSCWERSVFLSSTSSWHSDSLRVSDQSPYGRSTLFSKVNTEQNSLVW